MEHPASSRPQRAVLVVATSKLVFVQMALSLARSFFYGNPGTDIGFYLLTDLDFELPPDLREVRVIHTKPNELGSGFSAKLRVDLVAPAAQTLLIDADCLFYGRLDPVFDRLAGRKTAVVGSTISTGRWWCDIDATRARFGLGPMPYFNGGLYYLEPGPEATAVYDRARELEAQYDEVGLIRLRGRPNDEIVMSIAMAERGWLPVEDPDILGNVDTNCPLVTEMDILAGVWRMSNPPPPHPMHRTNFPVTAIAPRVVHFLDSTSKSWRYHAETRKLNLVRVNGLPKPVARAVVAATVEIPGELEIAAKSLLRPAFHKLFGVRGVRSTDKNTI